MSLVHDHRAVFNILELMTAEVKRLKALAHKVVDVHRLSFRFGDVFMEFKGFQLAFRVYTMHNVYTLHKPKVEKYHDKMKVKSREYAYAGGQKKCSGLFEATLVEDEGSVLIEARAEHDEVIKCYGILLKDLEYGKILDTDWSFKDPEGVIVFSYPWIWLSMTRYLPSPIFFIEHLGKEYTFALSLDDKVRPKRFRVVNHGRKLELALFHEEDARLMSTHLESPPWRIGRTKKPELVIEERMKLMEEKWGLKPWEIRDDVPSWARRVCLVVNLHFKHWTGYAFNTYKTAAEALNWIAERISGENVLVYMPGWDGRYYYDYPIMEPDPELGGKEGFKQLIEHAHSLGMHVVPMTSAVAVGFSHIEKLGFKDAIVMDKYGNRLYENWVDWDEDGERDNIWYPVNLGHPAVKKYFIDKISSLIDEYQVDGIFLDICHFYENDPRYSFYEGLRDIIASLLSKYKGKILIMGECWYDALLPIIPMTHSHNLMPKNWPYFYLKYARMTYHLSWPAPGSGSTGVHEKGFGKFELPRLDAEIIPTLTIVDDTLTKYRDQAEKVIEIAKEWGAKRGIL